MTPTKYAFCCKNCGRLAHSDEAGECEHPHACRVCGSGVSFTPKGIKKVDKDNWEVLVECSDKRLKELGLTKDMIEKHVPFSIGVTSDAPPQNISREGMEGVGIENKVEGK